jgi:hypothetical protein
MEALTRGIEMADGMRLEDAMNRAEELIMNAEKMRIPLRLMGSCSVYVHCPEYRNTLLHVRTDISQQPITDLDFVSYSRYQEGLEKILTESGCVNSIRTSKTGVQDGVPSQLGRGGFTQVTLGREFSRLIYIDQKTSTTIDVFLDKLAMCHTIDFKNRLEIDHPTIPLADILLEKMQIVEIAEKDVKDTIVLLLEHDIGDSDRETINDEYISRLLSRDWGFYYTVTTNLRNVRDKFLPLYEEHISNELAAIVRNRISGLLESIERVPKDLSWRMRAKIGTKRRWYQEVG